MRPRIEPPPPCDQRASGTLSVSMRIFCNLAPAEIQDFESIGIEANLPKGAILFRKGDFANSVALLRQGQAKLLGTSGEGKVLILSVAVPGDLIGLGAVVSDSRHVYTAETVDNAVVKSIHKNEFLAFLQRHSRANVGVAGVLSREYKAAFFDDRPVAPAPSAAGRLASIILEFCRGAGHDCSAGSFTMALTHQDLADLAGTSRETVTRVLSSFRRQRFIHTRGASMAILDPDSLIRLATHS